MHDFLFGIRQRCFCRVDEWLPHIHGHRFNRRALFRRQLLIITLQRRFLTALADVFNRVVLQVADQRHILMPLGDSFLVDANMTRRSCLFAFQAAGHGTVQYTPGLVPAGAQDALGAGNRAFSQDINGQSLKHQREARFHFGPRHPHLFGTVRGAVDARDARVQEGCILATVEMAPGAFFRVVKHAVFRGAFRTWPLDFLRVLNPDIDAQFLLVQCNATD